MTDITQKLDALDKLIAAVEAGDSGNVNRILGQMFAADHSLPWEWVSNVNSAFKGSLDAALALHNALLPGWCWSLRDDYDPEETAAVRRLNGSKDEVHYGDGMNTPARAWLIAILKAYREQETTK